MKECLEDRPKLTSDKKTKSCSPTVRILDIPGVQKLEDLLRVGMPIDKYSRVHPADIVGDLCKKLSQEIFGIQSYDTEFQLPEGYEAPKEHTIEYQQLQEVIETHDRQFETLYLCDDDIVDFLKKYGLDFSDNYGKPLLCINHFAVQAEFAIKKLGGNLPDSKAVSIENWGISLEEDARKFRAKKRGRS